MEDQENDPITFDWLESIIRGFMTVGMVGGVYAKDWRVTAHRQPNGGFAFSIVGENGEYANANCKTRTQFIRLASVVGLPLRGICTS